MQSVTIVCDGSSRLIDQKRMAGAAAVLISGNLEISSGLETASSKIPRKFKLVAAALGEATNQRAEINAVILGLKQIKVPCKVKVLTDSKYVIETMKGNFSKRANLDLWGELERIANRHQIKWEWIKGHSSESSELYQLQKLTDRVANRVAERQDFPPDFRNEIEEKIMGVLRLSENSRTE
jgi:ribonuclease HI